MSRSLISNDRFGACLPQMGAATLLLPPDHSRKTIWRSSIDTGNAIAAIQGFVICISSTCQGDFATSPDKLRAQFASHCYRKRYMPTAHKTIEDGDGGNGARNRVKGNHTAGFL